ncbi:hypothetical protein AAMO2058_001577800 [Amorphochlora amoebiformis]
MNSDKPPTPWALSFNVNASTTKISNLLARGKIIARSQPPLERSLEIPRAYQKGGGGLRRGGGGGIGGNSEGRYDTQMG